MMKRKISNKPIFIILFTCIGSLNFFSSAQPSAGDECKSAYPANTGSNYFDTTEFSSSWPLPDDSQCPGTSLDWGDKNPDVWFVFSVDISGDYTFTTCDAESYDTSMVLYEDSCDNQVACNGDGSGQTGCQDYYSLISYTLEADKEYFIRIGGWNGNSGLGKLTISGDDGNGKGACCIDGTECFISDREYCIEQGGDWTKGADCSSINCGGESSWGACCIEFASGKYACYDGEVGKDHNESVCLQQGGEWTESADCSSIECPPIATPTVWHVDQSSTNTPDGTSWSTAFLDVQDALAVASNGDQIWIAEGWYVPTDTNGTSDSREASFRLIAGVEMYGGFSGNETSLGQQQPDVYRVIFSGDLNDDDGEGGDSSDNAYHVVTADGLVGNNPILDGIYIRSGNANSTGNNKFGGGLIISNTPANSSAYPLIRQCRFILNQAFYGGGIATSSINDRVALINCTLAKNYASRIGGAICNNGSCGVDNTLIFGNSCEETGGALFSAGNQLKLINTTITQNSASFVAGIYIQSGNNNVGSNNIIWGNRDVNGDHIQLHIQGGSWSGNYNCIENIGSSLGGVGNIDLDPRFVNALGNDGDAGTGDEDFHLLQQSPCIDAGDNTVVTENYDFDGDNRLIDDPYTNDTGFGEAPIVDMGVDEHTPELGGGDVSIWYGSFSDYFDDYKNWLPSGVPSKDDTAIFNESWLCHFYGDNTIGGLFITGGDLTFDLSGITLELASQSDPLRVTSYDSSSSVTFRGGPQASGTLKIQNAPLRLTGSNISFKDDVELRTQGILLRGGTTFNFDGDMYGNLTNTGSAIHPGGRNVGELVIYGDLIHQATQMPDADDSVGSMVFDLNGYDLDGNVGSDHIEVKLDGDGGGIADLECVIELRWDRAGLVPNDGDTYDILTSSYILGQPLVVYCSGLPSDLGFTWFTPEGPGIRGGSEGGVETTGPILFESSGSTDLNNSTEPNDIVVADFDGINGSDVAMSVPNGNSEGTIVILLNSGMSGDTWLGFTETPPITVGIDPRDLEVGDFNGDGTANDLVVANYADDNISVLQNDNSGNFTKINVSTDTNPIFIAIGDYVANDGSDLDDIAVACDSFLVTVLQNTTTLGPSLSFVNVNSIGIPMPLDIDPGDVNNDKDLDYICLDGASEEVRVLEGTGDGSVVTGPIGSVAGTSLPSGSTPAELEFADINIDGIQDAITVNEGDNSLSILLGDGSEFGSASSFAVGTSPQSMTIHDFDNDGDDDLVVSIIDEERELIIIRNDSTGTIILSAGDAIGSGSDPILVEHGDFNQDGLEDLACVIDLGAAPVRTHVNPSIGIYFNTTLVTCDGDINNDGTVDVADLLAIIGAWSNTSGPEDVDGDGVVAVGDLLIVIGSWGSC